LDWGFASLALELVDGLGLLAVEDVFEGQGAPKRQTPNPN
jgi:hypothetical protein